LTVRQIFSNQMKRMLKFCVVLIVTCCSFASVSYAQDTTNAPKTEIENFELQTGTVIVKGLGEIGSVTTSAGSVQRVN
jgi:hypothetical protein